MIEASEKAMKTWVLALVSVFGEAGSLVSPKTFSAGFAAAIEVSAALSLLGAVAAMGLPGLSSSRVAVVGPLDNRSIVKEGSTS